MLSVIIGFVLAAVGFSTAVRSTPNNTFYKVGVFYEVFLAQSKVVCRGVVSAF